ncbi:hypothetical protein STEG23_010764 [Scotinomys teguina]
MRLVSSFCRANGVQRELSIVSFAATKEPWILESRGKSHSTPFKKGIKHSELRRNKRTVDPRITREISFDSIQEGDKNSTSSYIQHTLLVGIS